MKKFKKNKHWLAVGLAALLVVAGVAGALDEPLFPRRCKRRGPAEPVPVASRGLPLAERGPGR